MTEPAVSVLMSVHDGAPWVADAITSILDQTLTDLELVVVDDESTDGTPEILAGIRDGRLRVERRPRMGLTRALNHALSLARAPLLARLDADDRSLPDRLARQKRFLDEHPDIGLVGSAAREVDAADHEVGVISPPTEDIAIRRVLIRRNPFVHSSVVMRRSLVEGVGGYDASCRVAQDYDLWMRMSLITRLANLPDVLVERRVVPKRLDPIRDEEQLQIEARVRWRAVREGAYPPWCAVFAARAVLALALPRSLRRVARAAAGRGAR